MGGAAAVHAAIWSARHPGPAILGWVALVVLCVAGGAATSTHRAAGSDFWVGEAGRAEAIAAAGGLTRPGVEHVLVTGPPDDARMAARAVTDRMRTLPGVAAVTAPVLSPAGDAFLVTITLAVDEATAAEHVAPVLEQTAQVQATYPRLRIEQAGDGSVERGVEARLGGDLRRAEAIVLPITLVVLVVMFGSVLAAVVPLLLAMLAVAAATGLAAVTSHAVPFAGGAVLNVVLLMGLAVGVDYSLFYLHRVREERERDPVAAVELAAATAGRALVVSGCAVIVTLLGLYVVDDVIFTSMATAVIGVVLVAVIGTVTALPAVLTLLGPRIARRRAPRPARLLSALLGRATTRPVATLVLASGALLALSWPVTNLRLAVEGVETFPRSIPAVESFHRVVDAFPQLRATHLVAVRGDAVSTERAVRELARAADPDPLVRVSADGRIATVALPTRHGPDSAEGRASLHRLRTQLLPSTLGRIPGVEYAVSGDVARSVDYAAHQGQRLPWVLVFVLGTGVAVMAAAFRSLVIGLLALALNLLSAGAALGAVVAVFQYRWAEELLGFTATGFVGSRIPLLVFVVLFGLSTDYQIFVVSRVREAVRHGLPTRQAVPVGVVASARVVTSAALVLVTIFTAFLFVGVVELKQTGFGLAVAILLDAVVVRILILPAALTLMGERAWWPDRRPTRIGGSAPAPAPRR